MKALHVPKALAECTIRITLGPENTAMDIRQLLAALKLIIQ